MNQHEKSHYEYIFSQGHFQLTATNMTNDLTMFGAIGKDNEDLKDLSKLSAIEHARAICTLHILNLRH